MKTDRLTGYRMDRTILNSKDMQMILAGLRCLDSVSGRDSILIDLSSWYRETLALKIHPVKVRGLSNHIIWCFGGQACISGAGARIGKTLGCSN